MMLMWNMDIIFHSSGQKEDNELIYMVTNSRDYVNVPKKPKSGPEVHLLFHRFKHPYNYHNQLNHFGYLREQHSLPSPCTIITRPEGVITETVPNPYHKPSPDSLHTPKLPPDDAEPHPRLYSGKKRGRKAGDGKKYEITVAEWWGVCDSYRKATLKMSKTSFLKSSMTSQKFSGSKSQQQSFGRYLKRYDNDPDWKPVKKFKFHKRPFAPIEEKLIAYLTTRAQRYKRDKLGVSWNWMKLKCNEWAEK